jgi:hypothetical protein
MTNVSQTQGTSTVTRPADAFEGIEAAFRSNGSSPPTSPDLKVMVPIAVEIGWVMAVLFGRLEPGLKDPDHLPSEHDLPEEVRRRLEVGRLHSLCDRLCPALSAESVKTLRGVKMSDVPTPKELQKMNLAILGVLACTCRPLEGAYQLGRSLRDTVNPPLRCGEAKLEAAKKSETAKVTALTKQLSHHRVLKLQESMAILSPFLPENSAVIVGASVGRWSDFARTVLDKNSPGGLCKLSRDNSTDKVVEKILRSLLAQGDAWLNILIGAESTCGLLTPEAYVAAGEAALSRTVRIVRRIILHYWVAFFVLAVALAAVIYSAAHNLSGAGKVWTQIGAIAGTLGVSFRAITDRVARMSGAAERPIYQSETLDAMAWAVTTLPRVKLNNSGVRALRRSGIQKSRPLGPV